jgi:arabinose-5-phosphate isomerase
VNATPGLDVVGIGSMVVDRVHRCPRLLGGDEKLILHNMAGGCAKQIHVGGVVLNHLGWAASLGLRTGIFGRQADDEEGRFLRNAMDEFGIVRNIVLDGTATSVAEIFVDDKGARAIYMAPSATLETTPAKIRTDHAAFIRSAARFTTEVSQLPLDAALAALEIARAAGIPTLVDLDVPPRDAVATLGSEAALDAVLRAADILKPAKRAVCELVPTAGGDPLEIARAMRERYGNPAVVVTDGEAGCAIATEAFEGFVASRSVVVVDTTGAGDAFVGGLLTGLHHGLEWEAVAHLANAAGAACVEKIGAFPDDPVAARNRVMELYEGPALELGPVPDGEVAPTDSVSRSLGLSAIAAAVEQLASLRSRLDPASFDSAVALIQAIEVAGGGVQVMGLAKSEHTARYAASLLSSTGTQATFLHAGELLVSSTAPLMVDDVVIIISHSDESPEIHAVVDIVHRAGARIIAVTGELDSWLAKRADLVLDAGVAREGGSLGLQPRVSAAAEHATVSAAEVLVLGALSAALQNERGLTPRVGLSGGA